MHNEIENISMNRISFPFWMTDFRLRIQLLSSVLLSKHYRQMLRTQSIILDLISRETSAAGTNQSDPRTAKLEDYLRDLEYFQF